MVDHPQFVVVYYRHGKEIMRGTEGMPIWAAQQFCDDLDPRLRAEGITAAPGTLRPRGDQAAGGGE